MPIRPEMKERYPTDWQLRSRFVRFQRAEGQCEWVDDGERCPKIHGQSLTTKSDVVLTAAHMHDHRPENASLLNLAALCQQHHLAYDASMRQFAKEMRREKIELKDEVVWQVESGGIKYVWSIAGPWLAVRRANVERGWFDEMPKYTPRLVKWDHGQRTVMIRDAVGWRRSGLLIT